MKQNTFEYLIIGAGPAGLQLAYFLEKAQRSYLLLERGQSVGTFFRQYPRHRKLISINKVFTGYDNPEINLRWDWNSLLCDDPNLNFSNYSQDYFPHTDALVNYLEDFSSQLNLQIQFDTEVVNIKKDAALFSISDQNQCTYTSKRLIIATGLSIPYVPDIPGIELAENYTSISLDRASFANQRVLIIGKGNSSFETADHLVSSASLIHVVSPTPIKMAWQTKYVGHLRAVNNNFLDTYQLKSQNGILDADVIQIKQQEDEYHVSFNYTHAHGEQETITYDRVIVCTGFQFDCSIFDESCQPMLSINDRFPTQTSEWESVNVSGLYFAGVLMHMRDFKKKQSGFIHGFRHNIQALCQILDYKYHQIPLPFKQVRLDADRLTQAVLERVNTSAGLWQQTGFLCDGIILDHDKQHAQYFKDLPREYILTASVFQEKDVLLITLEFGEDIDKVLDPFSINRVHKDDEVNAKDSAFIHPVVRYYRNNQLFAEHHVIEDLEAEWTEDIHISPLKRFIDKLISSKDLELTPKLKRRMSLNPQAGNAVFRSNKLDFFDRKQNGVKSNLDSSRKIGECLIDAGLINDAQLNYALSEQPSVRLKVGEIMVRHGWLTQKTVDFFVAELLERSR